MKSNTKKDIFIVHASEDKESLVRPLALRLEVEGVNVWFDEFSLQPGDSISEKIDQGLSGCRFAAVVLSKNFFSKNWPKKELYSLLSRENFEGVKIVLPIWHDISEHDVASFSTIMKDRFAIDSGKGMNYVVNEILKVVKPDRVPSRHGAELKVAVGIVRNGNKFLVVKRRHPEGKLEWQFPAGVVKAWEEDKDAIIREILEETGITCTIIRKIGERVGPDTDRKLSYWECAYQSGELTIGDADENVAVEWVTGPEALKLFTSDVFGPIQLLLDESD